MPDPAWTIYTIHSYHEKITYKGGDNQDMNAEIIRARRNKDKKNMPAVIYCHGGGAILGQASNESSEWYTLAYKCDVVVINIDFRLGPEHKTPAGMMDCKAALQYFADNAA